MYYQTPTIWIYYIRLSKATPKVREIHATWLYGIRINVANTTINAVWEDINRPGTY